MKRRHTQWGVILLTLVLPIVVVASFAVQAATSQTTVSLASPLAQTNGGQTYLPVVARNFCPVANDVPFLSEWSQSGHNDKTAEAFRHWDAEGSIPTSCAKCHSTPGYRDFLGADGSAPNVVNKAHPTGTTVECTACHNNVTLTKTSVTFPSGITIANLGDESRCMECHQGRASKKQVDDAITSKALPNVDTVTTTLSFINIHYFAAAATQYGTQVKGGYEYDGQSYDHKFFHVEGYNTCYQCHDQHSLELKISECTACHPGVTTADDFANARMAGSLGDYDGDGNFTEGVGQEIAGLQEKLYTAIKAYGNEISHKAIAYDSHTHPYFFIDTNGNGQVDPDEAKSANRYNAFTARLLKAAYNYQVSQKDPGKFAHNGKYIIQILHDSIVDVNKAISAKVDMSKAWRIDPGHFAGSEEAFRHWDEEGEVPAGCARCHSSEGLHVYHKDRANVSEEVSNGFKCTTCHASLGGDWPRYAFDNATFPSGAVATFGKGADPNLCLQCHQGRSSGKSVVQAIAGKELDTVTTTLRFINIHYFAAGATLFGSDVNGLYEYAGKTYKGRFMHVGPFDTCTECHNTHKLEVRVGDPGLNCSSCHPVATSVEKLVDIRMGGPDYDGDGNTTEGIAGEIRTMADRLLTAMQAYADAREGVDPIVYNPNSYPYFFNDKGTGYATWTPRLLRTAYIYQYVQKDPGGFAHNGKYIIQVLYDALMDLSVDVSGMTRP
ncbi:MAG: hypothetical protein A2Z04_07215 [Chloroflexi bacterium RBG_16_57_9]|nr:MAG: hypothetical protein A2Z04_07215 [Chloroflexi bacterium RBG_16_57_9]